MTSLDEKYAMGKNLYKYILDNPMVRRTQLNLEFKASSNDSQGNLITEMIGHMLSLRQVHRYRNDDTGSLLYWADAYKYSPHKPDTIFPKDTVPINIFSDPPNDDLEEETQEDSNLIVDPPKKSTDSSYTSTLASLNGSLKAIYSVIAARPDGLFGKDHSDFDKLVPTSKTRAQMLGRLWSLDFIRRAKDKDSVFYTLTGVFPPTLVEEQNSRAAIKLKAQPVVKTKVLDAATLEAEPEDTSESAEEVEDASDESSIFKTAAFMDSNFEFALLRDDGSMLHFSEKENAAWTQMILNINIQRLYDKK